MPADPSEPSATGEIDPALVVAIERLALELADRARFAAQPAQLERLIGILILRGHLTETPRHILERVRAPRSLPVVFGSPADVPDPDIDCPSLLPLCRGRC